ncbi:hypothetical protein FOA43_002652 [Brettanomyces nanus]|uniref:Fe2OG dioxygenase domain-containing protein n=1 Tax=Eeniella nana TaxID=13502 RepID=A0A875S0K8_EENNA|nr:uncharacterized protein FOA43_002652 [Brettanomyces nanus]QPG75301.1 hypothetical protein FOA43_002652 [Brettanomyces nanus]
MTTDEIKKEVTVPVIDFKPFLEGTAEGKENVGKKMIGAMRDIGFMYIINHGIPQSDQKRMLEWSASFFKLPDDKKMLCEHPKDGAHHRGWSAIGMEKVVQMVFDRAKISELRQHPDVKESFDSGNENNKECFNIWPRDEDIPGFREFCNYYFKVCETTADRLLRALALGLNLDENYLLKHHEESNNQLRLLCYPPTLEKNLREGKTERIAAHTDFGTLTMLLQDDCGGLQVEKPSNPGVFIDAPVIPGSLVINTGDFLMRWSNDQLKSTFHRVTAPPVDSRTGISKIRYSIPYFVSADRHKVIDALPGTFSEQNPKKYEPITSGEYLAKRLNATY